MNGANRPKLCVPGYNRWSASNNRCVRPGNGGTVDLGGKKTHDDHKDESSIYGGKIVHGENNDKYYCCPNTAPTEYCTHGGDRNVIGSGPGRGIR